MKIPFLIALIFLLSNCREKEQKYDLPIEKNVLKALLIDLYIAGAAVEMNPALNKDSLKTVYHTEICKMYKLESKQLAFIIERLHALPKLNGEIQKQVLDSMNAMQNPGFNFHKNQNKKNNKK